jgi:hypothetical protein
MVDTCSPEATTTLYSFRAYSIIIPVALIVLFLEAMYILAKKPGTLGSALTSKGPFTLPKVPTSG